MSFVKAKDGKKYLFINNGEICPKCVADTDDDLCIYLSTECGYGHFIELPESKDKDETTDSPVPKKHAQLIKAWADGAKIQRFDKPFYHRSYSKQFGGWKDVEDPTWKDSTKYRIKPTKEMEELKDLIKQKREVEAKIQKLQNIIKGV